MKAIAQIAVLSAMISIPWSGNISADVVTGAGGGQNVMVTFDDPTFFAQGDFAIQCPSGEDASPRITPFTYYPQDASEAGVDVTTEGDALMSIAIGPEFSEALACGMPAGPLVRFVKSPLLATLGSPDAGLMSLRFSFHTPTPIFGFGLGFNASDADQPKDGSPTHRKVATVRLYDEEGREIGKYPLYASRLFCCTETRFDYSYCDNKARRGKRSYVAEAVIDFEYDYIPFHPTDPTPGAIGPKFFGIDDLTYSTGSFECDGG